LSAGKANCRDNVADDEAGDAPEYGGDGRHLDWAVHVVVARVGRACALERDLQDEDRSQHSRHHEEQSVESHGRITRPEQHKKPDRRANKRADQCHGIRERGPFLDTAGWHRALPPAAASSPAGRADCLSSTRDLR
jgi:hypothetical protein